jgi:hypothetical protein
MGYRVTYTRTISSGIHKGRVLPTLHERFSTRAAAERWARVARLDPELSSVVGPIEEPGMQTENGMRALVHEAFKFREAHAVAPRTQEQVRELRGRLEAAARACPTTLLGDALRVERDLVSELLLVFEDDRD